MKSALLPSLAAAAFLAASAAHAEPAASSVRVLTVSGTGEAAAAPDLATLSIGVEAEGATASEAVRAMSAQMAATIARLKSGGVADRDLQTSGLSVGPRYNYQNNQSPKIIGYTASNTVTAKLRDVKKAGALIDAAVKDGANRLNGLSLGFADSAPLENKARAAAVADARAKAETLARAAGVTLGPILQIQDGFAEAPPTPIYRAAAAPAVAKAVPVEAGESSISASVTLIYEIR